MQTPLQTETALWIAGGLLSAPVLIASIRAILFFGAMTNAMKNMQVAVNDGKKAAEDAYTELREIHADHETRITVIETERRIEGRAGRRGTDPLIKALGDTHGNSEG